MFLRLKWHQKGALFSREEIFLRSEALRIRHPSRVSHKFHAFFCGASGLPPEHKAFRWHCGLATFVSAGVHLRPGSGFQR
jgi:hypothetical protein